MTLEALYAGWCRLGALPSVEPTTETVWPEDLLANTFDVARDDARLFIIGRQYDEQPADVRA